MSKADQFWQHAEEDVRWARRSTIDKEKKRCSNYSGSRLIIGGIPIGLGMSKSLRIDSPFGGLGCRRPILVTCGSALSQLWRPARRERGGGTFRGQRGVGGKVAAALV
jgi:hypothetical protein